MEFKVNNSDPDEIGEYCSALSNSAALIGEQYGYLVFGVQDKDVSIVGATFDPKTTKVGNHELENWLATQLEPRIDFEILPVNFEGKSLVIFRIDATKQRPVAFKGK